jgi:glycosyltransferase involved in cell wall biosynthesis
MIVMADPLLSVVIPYYNGSKYLCGALAMLAAQTLKPCEIVVVDDGSDGEDRRAAERIIAQFKDARLFRQDNAGPGAARNRGVSESSGQFVAFLDVDDDWAETKLEKQVAWFADHPGVDLVLTESDTVSEHGEIQFRSSLAELSTKQLIDKVLRGSLHSFTSSIMVRRALFDQIGGFEEKLRFREDHLFLLRALIEADVAVVPEALSRRRMHLDSMSGAGSNLDPRLSLVRAELFWREAKAYVPGLPVKSLEANELIRLARKYIVLGERRRAVRTCISAFLVQPSRPRHLAYIAAAVWSVVQPGRFDYWHTGFAQIRQNRRHSATQ